MKMTVIKDCECLLQKGRKSPDDCSLKAGQVIEGERTQTTNWKGEPMNAFDFKGKKISYYAVPADCLKEVEMNHREWLAGSTVVDRHGYAAKLLAPTWSGFAWIKYDSEKFPTLTVPVTINADELTLVEGPK